jgi:hypothetical protein
MIAKMELMEINLIKYQVKILIENLWKDTKEKK